MLFLSVVTLSVDLAESKNLVGETPLGVLKLKVGEKLKPNGNRGVDKRFNPCGIVDALVCADLLLGVSGGTLSSTIEGGFAELLDIF